MSTEVTQKLFDRHLELWIAGDVDGIMEDFHPDAYMVNGNGVTKGLDEIRAFYTKVFTELFPDEARAKVEFNKRKYDGDVAFSEWSAPDLGVTYAADTMVAKDGKKWIETFAAVYG